MKWKQSWKEAFRKKNLKKFLNKGAHRGEPEQQAYCLISEVLISRKGFKLNETIRFET